MKALLIVAHGSQRAASNDEVRDLAARVGDLAGGCFDRVQTAFLELAEPSIPDGIQACIDAGADEVVVMPYFLSAGRHVSEDIPAEVARKQQEHRRVRIRVADYVGAQPGIADLLVVGALAGDGEVKA